MRIRDLMSSGRRQARQLKDGSNFHGSLLGSGYASCDIDRLVEVRRVDHEKPTELFARLGERAIRNVPPPFADAHAARA